MYDYNYTEDVLLLLRLLRFLREDDPAGTEELIRTYDELNDDTVYEIAEAAIWGGYGFIEMDYDEECEMSIACLSHPVINRFLSLAEEWQEASGGGSAELFQKKVQDLVEFYVCCGSHSVFEMNFSFSTGAAWIRLTLSPDCYEPLLFANSLVDLLLCFKQENKRLEELLKEHAAGNPPVLNAAKKEAA